MDDLSEALEREIAGCDYEVAKLRFMQAPRDQVRRAEVRAAHRATRLSQAYRSGDVGVEILERQALLTPLDYFALLLWRRCAVAAAGEREEPPPSTNE